MPLIELTDLLRHAGRNSYAVGALPVGSLDDVVIAVAAAERVDAPLILSISDAAFGDIGFELAMPAIEAAADRARVPVVLHFTHGVRVESVVAAIRLGCNSVAVDASPLADTQPATRVREAASIASACGLPVEAVIDAAAQTDEPEREPVRPMPANVEATLSFVRDHGIDVLAMTPDSTTEAAQDEFDGYLNRLRAIHESAGIPLALRNGATLSDERIRAFISCGVAKIDFGKTMGEPETPHGQHVERFLRRVGASGRAEAVLAECGPWTPVEHVVVFNAPDLDRTGIQALFETGMRDLGGIPGVRKVWTGWALKEDARYRLCWLIRFASAAVVDSFREHPAHVAFADTHFRPVAVDRLTADFALGPVAPPQQHASERQPRKV